MPALGACLHSWPACHRGAEHGTRRERQLDDASAARREASTRIRSTLRSLLQKSGAGTLGPAGVRGDADVRSGNDGLLTPEQHDKEAGTSPNGDGRDGGGLTVAVVYDRDVTVCASRGRRRGHPARRWSALRVLAVPLPPLRVAFARTRPSERVCGASPSSCGDSHAAGRQRPARSGRWGAAGGPHNDDAAGWAAGGSGKRRVG